MLLFLPNLALEVLGYNAAKVTMIPVSVPTSVKVERQRVRLQLASIGQGQRSVVLDPRAMDTVSPVS